MLLSLLVCFAGLSPVVSAVASAPVVAAARPAKAPPAPAPPPPAEAPVAVAPAPVAPVVVAPLPAAPPVVELKGLSARIRALTDLIALDLKRLPGDHRTQRFAVLPFEATGPQAQDRQLGVVVSELVTTDLVRDHDMPLVERSALGKILDEQALGQSGAINDAQAAKIGSIAGARALVVGQVSEVADGFRVTVRAVDAESAAVLSAQDTTLPSDELIAYAAAAVVLRSKSGALFRSLVFAGWGQGYNDQPLKGFALGGMTGAFGLATLGTAAAGVYVGYVLYPQLGQRPEDKKRDASELPPLVGRTRETANALFVASSVLLGATALSYAATAVDAYLSGHDVDAVDDAAARF